MLYLRLESVYRMIRPGTTSAFYWLWSEVMGRDRNVITAGACGAQLQLHPFIQYLCPNLFDIYYYNHLYLCYISVPGFVLIDASDHFNTISMYI